MLGRFRRVHFVGIGGIGMSGLAQVFHNLGFEVTGSDLTPTQLTREMEGLGIKIVYNHNPENIGKAEVVVYSSAVAPDNPELTAARNRMVPVIPRAEMLAELMRLKYSIAISGAHGKTTTTSLLAWVMERCNLDPTSVIGGRVQGPETNARLGKSEYLVAEADESDRSFLLLFPTLALITSIDEEHMDCYKDIEEIKDVFVQFANRVPFYGAVIANFDDPRVREILPMVHRRVITYGTTSGARIKAFDIELGATTHFWVQDGEEVLGEVLLPLAGRHNLVNSLAVIGVARELDLPFFRVTKAISEFPGVRRRLEVLGERSGVVVVDDYGHHPTEIEETIRALRLKYPGRRLVVIFQPHRYTRTRALYPKFGQAFDEADWLFLLPIYSAGERPIPGVGTELILGAVLSRNPLHPRVRYMEERSEVVEAVSSVLVPGDLVLTLGAGDVWEIGQELLARL